MKAKQFLKLTLCGAMAVSFVGCAGAKVKNERVPLKNGTLTKADLILVKEISADNAIFIGDKSADKDKVDEEKKRIRIELPEEIVQRLQKKGFNAKAFTGNSAANAIILEGSVGKVDHGSAAARAFVGMGSGSSNMVIDIKITKAKVAIADFQIVASSGGRGGWTSMGSFIKAHIVDAASRTADYLAKHAD